MNGPLSAEEKSAAAIRDGLAAHRQGRLTAAFAKLRSFQAALSSFGQAIDIKNDFCHAYSNRGNVFKELGQWQAALDDYDKAVALNAGFAEAHSNRAEVSRRLMRFDAAMAGYDCAFALKPDLPFLSGQRLHASMQVCAWRTVEAEMSAMAAGIERGEPVSPPFAVAAFSYGPDTAGNRHTAALFDISRYIRDLESAYARIYDRYQADLPAEHL
jgi:tetratricopeptide (TPR) repeat protein